MSEGERQQVDDMLREAGSLLHLIGGMGSAHLVLIGGLVPPLLVEDAAEPHVGTADVDFCLSVAITSGATREYYKSIEDKISQYFEPANGSAFRWRKKLGAPGIRILVDFLAPEEPSDEVLGEGVRALDDDRAAENIGPRLRPFTLKTGDLVELDAEERELDIELLYKADTKALVRIRHAGPVGFLIAKAFALDSRDEDKDGYDVAWFCLNAGQDPDRVAETIASRPAFSHQLVPEGLAILRKAFKARDYVGPSGYARESAPGEEPGSDAFERARNDAFLASSEIIEALISRIDWSTQL